MAEGGEKGQERDREKGRRESEQKGSSEKAERTGDVEKLKQIIEIEQEMVEFGVKRKAQEERLAAMALIKLEELGKRFTYLPEGSRQLKAIVRDIEKLLGQEGIYRDDDEARSAEAMLIYTMALDQFRAGLGEKRNPFEPETITGSQIREVERKTTGSMEQLVEARMEEVRKRNPELSKAQAYFQAMAYLAAEQDPFVSEVEARIDDELKKYNIEDHQQSDRNTVFSAYILKEIQTGNLKQGFEQAVETRLARQRITPESTEYQNAREQAGQELINALSFGPVRALEIEIKRKMHTQSITREQAEAVVLSEIDPRNDLEEKIQELQKRSEQERGEKLSRDEARTHIASQMIARYREAEREEQIELARRNHEKELQHLDGRAQQLILENEAEKDQKSYAATMGQDKGAEKAGQKISTLDDVETASASATEIPENSKKYEQLIGQWSAKEFNYFPLKDGSRRQTDYHDFRSRGENKDTLSTLWQVMNDYVPTRDDYQSFLPPNGKDAYKIPHRDTLFSESEGPGMSRAQLVRDYTGALYRKLLAAELIDSSGKMHPKVENISIRGQMVRLQIKRLGKDSECFFHLNSHIGQIQMACKGEILNEKNNSLRAEKLYEQERGKLSLLYWPDSGGGPDVEAFEQHFPKTLGEEHGIDRPVLSMKPIMYPGQQVYRITWVIPSRRLINAFQNPENITPEELSFRAIEVKRDDRGVWIRYSNERGDWSNVNEGWQHLSHFSLEHVWDRTRHFPIPAKASDRDNEVGGAYYGFAKATFGKENIQAFKRFDDAKTARESKSTQPGSSKKEDGAIVSEAITVEAYTLEGALDRMIRFQERNQRLAAFKNQGQAVIDQMSRFVEEICPARNVLQPKTPEEMQKRLSQLDELQRTTEVKDLKYQSFWKNYDTVSGQSIYFGDTPLKKDETQTVATAMQALNDRMDTEQALLRVEGMVYLEKQALEIESLQDLDGILAQANDTMTDFMSEPTNLTREFAGGKLGNSMKEHRDHLNEHVNERLKVETSQWLSKINEGILELKGNFELVTEESWSIPEDWEKAQDAVEQLELKIVSRLGILSADTGGQAILSLISSNKAIQNVKIPPELLGGLQFYHVDKNGFIDLDDARVKALEDRDVEIKDETVDQASLPRKVETYGDLSVFMREKGRLDEQVRLAKVRSILSIGQHAEAIKEKFKKLRTPTEKQAMIQRIKKSHAALEELQKEQGTHTVYMQSLQDVYHRMPWIEMVSKDGKPLSGQLILALEEHLLLLNFMKNNP